MILNVSPRLAFDNADALTKIASLDELALDRLKFGVIGFDADDIVRRYNLQESRFSGLAPDEVIGRGLFTYVAQCMNNYLVAQRFHDAAASGSLLDDTIDYVLTWRMRPTPVRMRLLAAPSVSLRCLLLAH